MSAGYQTRQDVNRHPSTREPLSRCKKTGGKHGGSEDEEEQGRQMSRERIGETSERERHMSETTEAEMDKRGQSK